MADPLGSQHRSRYAACGYSLINPPEIGRRRSLSAAEPVTPGRGSVGRRLSERAARQAGANAETLTEYIRDTQSGNSLLEMRTTTLRRETDAAAADSGAPCSRVR